MEPTELMQFIIQAIQSIDIHVDFSAAFTFPLICLYDRSKESKAKKNKTKAKRRKK